MRADVPVTTVGRMLLSVATCLVLALILDARGIVHSGKGMQDGPMRTATLAVGNAALWIAQATRLDWPWDTLHTALGYTEQPAVAPLLASGVGSGPVGSGGAVLPGAGTGGAVPVATMPGSAARGGMLPAATVTATPLPSPTASATPLPSATPPTVDLPKPSAVPHKPHPAVLAHVHMHMHGHGRVQYPATARATATIVARPATATPTAPARLQARPVRRRTAIVEMRDMRSRPRTVAVARPVAAVPARRHPPIVPSVAHPRAPHRRASMPRVLVVMTDANEMSAIAHPKADFRLGISQLYCWVRNSTLPAGATRLTFTWKDLSTLKVLDRFPVMRSSWAYTGAYNPMATAMPGLYSCAVSSGGTTVGSAHFAIKLPPLRTPTSSHPLRLLVTGDSLTGYLGPVLVDAAAAGPVKGFVDTHNGTGLTRPDFVDWSVVARQQVAQDNPDVVVVMMGGNDFQNMTLPNGQFFQAGTPAWTAEYARRAAICMRIWTQGGTRRVYWLSMPPARDPTWAADDRQIDIALQRAAAEVPGATYLDVLGPVTNHGQYTDYVYDGHGQPILIREPDGVHLNLAGSTIVAQEVLKVLARSWHLR